MLRLIIVFAVFLQFQDLNSQISNDYKIGAVSTVKYNDQSIPEFTKELVAQCESDAQKVRLIFDWIAKNIRYDNAGLKSGYWRKVSNKQQGIQTLKLGKGICGGYASLFNEMVESLGVECKVVIGNAKTDDFNMVKDFENHAWNAVLIGRNWKLMDVTWASPKNKFGEIDSFYFDANPEIFIYTHYPSDQKWTLLQKKISVEEYTRFPQIGKMYYELGFKPRHPKYEIKKDSFLLDVAIPENMEINFEVTRRGTYDNEIQSHEVINLDGKKMVLVEIENPEDYRIELVGFSKKQMLKHFGILIVE